MKKSTKPIIIIGSVAAAVIISVAVVKLAFPGLHAYRFIKNFCTNIDMTAAEYPFYDAETPDDFMGSGTNGITLSLPAEMQITDMDADVVVFSDGEDNGTVVMVYSKELFDDSDSIINGESAEWYSFCENTFGYSITSYYSMLYAQFSITMDDFNIHDKNDSAYFEKLAALKETNTAEIMNIYNFETENGMGFVYDMGISDDTQQYNYAVELFQKGNGNEGHLIKIVSPNDENIKQIINSIDVIKR